MTYKKLVRFIVAGIFLLPTVTIAQSENDEYSPSRFGFAASIGGYRTLAVFDLEKLPCNQPGTKLLALQSPIVSLQDYLKKSDVGFISESVQETRALDKDKWQILIVGPGVDRDTLLQSYNELSESVENWGCARAVLPNKPVYYGTDGDQIYIPGGITGFPGAPGYALFENNDVTATGTIVGVEVYMKAPSVGNNQDLYSYGTYEVGGSRVMLNAVTNGGSSRLTIQTGLYFRKNTNPGATSGHGALVYTNDRIGLVMKFFFIAYTAGT